MLLHGNDVPSPKVNGIFGGVIITRRNPIPVTLSDPMGQLSATSFASTFVFLLLRSRGVGICSFTPTAFFVTAQHFNWKDHWICDPPTDP